MELKNPCLKCDHHLAGLGKSDRRCMACQERVDYVSQIGCLGSSLESNIQLVGNGGSEMPKIGNRSAAPAADKKSGVGKMNAHEKIVSDICAKHGISVEDLQNKRHGKPFSRARKEIAEILISKPGMTHAGIGKLIGVHGSRVGQIVMEKNPKKKASKKTGAGIGGPPPGTGDQGAGIKGAELIDTDEHQLVLDFSDHREIYDDLLKMASAELRTPENQALYMFKLIHEKRLNTLKIEEKLKFPQP